MTTIALPRRTVLAPVAWVLRSGWLGTDPEIIEAEDDDAVAAALSGGAADAGLLDPLAWARDRAAFRPVPRTAVALGPGGTDMLLAGAVRLDGLERVTAPPLPPRTSEEAAARAVVREYLGVQEPLGVGQEGSVAGEEGGIVTAPEALREQPHEHVESVSRAWWIMTGTPWVRALAVEPARAEPSPEIEPLFREIGRHLEQQAETVAAGLARERGGDEERWLDLVRALTLRYGAEERKGLSALLTRAARLRLAPKVEDAALPRY